MAVYSLSITHDSVSVIISGAEGYYYKVYCYEYDSYSGKYNNIDLGSEWINFFDQSTYIITGLSSDTQYKINVYLSKTQNPSSSDLIATSTGVQEFITDSYSSSVSASYRITEYDHESVTIKVFGANGYYYKAFCYEYDSNYDVSSEWIYFDDENTCIIDNLLPETKYKINVYLCSYPDPYDTDDLIATTTGVKTFTTLKSLVIENWHWDKSNGSATKTKTKNSYYAITNTDGYSVNDFSYLVWNDLCDKVMECIERAGSSWKTTMGPDGGTTPSYSKSRMTSSDKTLTADRFNAIRGNIGSRVSTGIEPVYSGDKVYGWYFETITNSLNEWIDNLNNN